MSWHLLTIQSSGSLLPEDLSSLLMSSGAGAVQELEGGVLHCYVEGAESLSVLQEECRRLGIVVLSSEPVKEDNWVAKCEEILHPIVLKKLSITPVIDYDERRQSNQNEIRILPALGFGTGHHATTRTLLEMLEDLDSEGHVFKNALDVGTGSGILAIGVSKLFACPVLAIDNDPDALDNARQNVELNEERANVALSLDSIEALSGPYELLIANIYAEVLIQMMPHFYRLIDLQGVILLSGIMATKQELVAEAIRDTFGDLTVEWRIVEGWCSGRFRVSETELG